MAKEILKKIVNKKSPIKSGITWLDEIRYIYLLSALVLITAFFLLLFFGFNYLSSIFSGTSLVDTVQEKIEQKSECTSRRLVDGLCLQGNENNNPPLVVAMIDNHMDARPQSGLSEAVLVYEAPVEGNYTRFMAFYIMDEKVESVGPIRSARPYFLDWTEEYGKPMYFHVGGSPQALQLIKNYNIFDFNEFFRSWYFWRSVDRLAPHNTYTSSELWKKGFDKYSYEASSTKFSSWKYEDYENCHEDECVTEITINYLSYYFEPTWKYNTSTEKYVRYENNAIKKDKNGSKIIADNIIVQFVESRVIDGVGRLDIETIGEGKALVFTAGRVFEGTWKKPNRQARTKWYNENGEQINLTVGTTWVQVTPQSTKTEWK
ncbi:MAG: DUF3048 domain-containing protein [Candidatus Magasanikbacteria bacterium]|nr:DUF3048 domain-containing protein [Candidatus Magasanikbacteria bacterium]